MDASFICPSCGANIPSTPGMTSVECPYCNTLVPVPETIQQENQEAQVERSLKDWGGYLIIFLVITVGLPTCLGLVATILGVYFGLLGTFAAVVFPVLLKFWTTKP